MDFSLSEDQELFRGTLKKYLNHVGRTDVAREFIKGNTTVAEEVSAGLAELGSTAIPVSEPYDGLGLGPLDLIPFFEETGRALVPGVHVETLALAVPLLEKYGTEAQKEKYLPEIASGSITATLAWLEAGKSYDPDGITCRAQQDGDDFIIDGVKTLVPCGDVFLALVRTAEGSKGEGLSLILIEQVEGVSMRKLNVLDETQHVVELTLNQVKVPQSQVVGAVGDGWNILQDGLLSFNAALSSSMVGAMDEIVSMAAEYAKIRIQFNQPIGRFQAIKHRIVNMKLDLETARSLSYYANWAVENQTDDRKAAVHSARSFNTEAFIRLASDNIQIHGGIGFTEEIDCHLFLKRARYYQNYLGSVRKSRGHIAEGLDWSAKKSERDVVSIG
ncbi:acyl-CoA dehydrogenase family protein [Sporosarcina sp. 179-K 3D1 HS]|uniref:acyl-CoA dehydrogenase family protein n=1 Tax=Sporosarcina sp. 179-K 3D1 HS TaxID=3232169 RepID=UPI0039A3B17A